MCVDMATLSNTELRNGVIFKDGNRYYKVINYEHVSSGRGSAVGKVKIKDLESGSVVIQSYKQNEKVESVDTERKSMQYLYLDDSSAYFMDAKNFEQISIPISIIDEVIKYISNGEKVIVLFVDDKPISVEIPKSVELKIVYTELAVKGNTTSNAMKEAKLENGLKISIPLFIKTGDVVKINTETGNYVSRVKQA